MVSDEMHERIDVLEGMRELCRENYLASMRMAKTLKEASVLEDSRPFAEQRRYSELAFNQLKEYLRASGWYGAQEVADEDYDEAMQDHILNGNPVKQ